MGRPGEDFSVVIVMDSARPETWEACRGRSLVDADTGEVVSARLCLRFASVGGPPAWPGGETGSYGYHVHPSGAPVTLGERAEDMRVGRWEKERYPVHVAHANLELRDG